MSDFSGRTRCPCLSGFSYDECCGPFHAGSADPPTAERLMRSRYTAFVLGDVDYLRRTWHPSTRPRTLELDLGRRWLGLEILSTDRGGMFDPEGTVEFRARRRGGGQPGQPRVTEQHEISRFVRVQQRWAYLDAV
ncbi:MAG: hypothetical protein JWO63_2874 [Frankiales bacterium]|jgi:SEC-C motif-containing protein|nr:hypothetical protein [Frankiales bacterium]